MATEKRLIDYYVVRSKSTGFYFRGKGANRWGEGFNQASIYRIFANAENTANWLTRRGEPAEIVPIRIIENPTVDAVEVAHGRWVNTEMGTLCTNCHRCFDPDFEIRRTVCRELKHCPDCGADMRERIEK